MEEIITRMVGRSLDNHFPDRKSHIQDKVLLSVQNATRHGVFSGIDFDLLKGEILGLPDWSVPNELNWPVQYLVPKRLMAAGNCV